MNSPRSIRLRSRSLLACLVLLLLPSAAFAAWPHDPSVSGVATRIAPVGNTFSPMAVRDGSGGVIVAWEESNNLYAQRIDANGTRLWGAGALAVCLATGTQSDLVMTEDGAGGAVLAWTDNRSGNYDIYAQRLNSSGSAQWTLDGVAICTAAANQIQPQIICDDIGNAIIAWRDLRNGNYDIYARRVSPLGTPTWALDGVAICTDPALQDGLVMTRDIQGQGLMAWVDHRTDAGDIYFNRVSTGGTVLDVNGNAVATGAGGQTEPAIVSDGGSGSIIAWRDERVGGSDLYIQKLNSSAFDLWAAGGVAVCTAAGLSITACLVGDGAGGVIVAWHDTRSGGADIYARRVDATGTALWTADGVALCTAPYTQSEPRITADAVDGAIVTWLDYRTGGFTDLYAQRVSSSGSVQWATNGIAISTAVFGQSAAQIITDDRGGAIVVYNDDRTLVGAAADLTVAQRVDEWGYLGAEPVIASVTDVPNDQGGKVKVSWLASPLDTDPLYRNIFEYQVYRSAPPLLVEHSLRAGCVSDDADVVSSAGAGTLLARPFGAQTSYWELVGTQAAIHLPTYSLIAPTTSDSVPGSNPQTAFLVLARNSGTTRWWWSVPDSGYSTDDLAPAPPAPFTGQYQGAITRLHWNPNAEPDLAGYRLYRGSSLAFAPDDAHRIASPPDTGWVDAAGAPYVYKLTAIDEHGNESLVATLTPAGTVDAPGASASSLFLAPPAPNPTRAGAPALLRFGLPAAGRVTLAVHDLQGRRVRVALDRELPAGEHRVRLDARGEGGPLAPGVYLVRLVTPAGARTARLAILE